MKHLNNLQQNKLEQYVALLLKWNKAINLVSSKTTEDIWHRHIQDCLQLQPYISQKDKLADLGSGAGLPGVVLSIIGYEKMTLVEVDEKKIRFLKEVRRQLDLDLKIIEDRVEDITHQQFDVITSRAMASLDKILYLSANIRTPETRLVLLKGKTFMDEISKALKHWKFEYIIHESKTSCDGVIIEVQKIRSIQ